IIARKDSKSIFLFCSYYGYCRYKLCGDWPGNENYQNSRHFSTRSTIIIEWKLSCNVNQCWWWLQPMERPYRYSLARRCYLRQLGNFLLYTRSGKRRILVQYLPAYLGEGRK